MLLAGVALGVPSDRPPFAWPQARSICARRYSHSHMSRLSRCSQASVTSRYIYENGGSASQLSLPAAPSHLLGQHLLISL